MNWKKIVYGTIAAGALTGIALFARGCGGTEPEKDALEGKVIESSRTYSIDCHTNENYARIIGVMNEYDRLFADKKIPQGPQTPAERFFAIHRMDLDGRAGVTPEEFKQTKYSQLEWAKTSSPANVQGAIHTYEKPTYAFDNQEAVEEFQALAQRHANYKNVANDAPWQAYLLEFAAREIGYQKDGERQLGAIQIEHPTQGKVTYIPTELINEFRKQVEHWEAKK